MTPQERTLASRRAARLALALALPAVLGGPLPALAADDGEDGRAALLQTGYESDADEFDALQLRAGVYFDYESYLRNSAFAVQDMRYSQDGWSKDVPAILGLYRNQQRDTLEGIRAEAGLCTVSGKVRPIGDVTWSLRPAEKTGVDLIAAGDVVGTREAIEQGISYGLVGASLEQQFGERFTGIALAGFQPFTDGNSRTLLRARMIYSLLPDEGLSLQARWRQYSSSKDDVTAYFNPDQYRNWDVGLSLRRHVGQWSVSALAGAGKEQIDNEPWKSTGLAELRAEGPLSGGKRLAFSVNYSRAAGFSNDPDYWYGSVNVSLIIPFR